MDDSFLCKNVTVGNVNDIRARAALTNNQEDDELLIEPINNDPATVNSSH